MIKAIIFDFGSVIYKTKWKELNDFFSEKNGFSVLIANSEDEELIRIYRDSDVGKENFKKFFFRINPNIADIKKILNDYREGYSKFKILNEDLLAIIKELKEQGFELFGFTDTKKEHYDANVASGIYNGFKKIFTSFEFGHLKRGKEAFKKLAGELKKYNISPPECIFVDDLLENIENAKDIGMKTIHYTDFPSVNSFREKLKRIINTNKMVS